ncbi:MAG TPA: phosphatase PAP2 family protein [Acidimicrobiia bacterium]|nr:phosphatase PAP2 family protein [Acidimicrobiia bacterium]
MALAVACALLVGLLYLFFVCTRLGQRIDDAAVDGRSSLTPEQVRDADDLLQTVDVASVVLLGGAVAFVAVVRGRLLLGAAVVGVIGAANVTTQVVKAVLPRSDLTGEPELVIGNSLPSGHTTVAASIAVAAILVAPRRLRGPIAVVGAVYAAAVGVATLTAGWHRPSDAVAAFAVVVAWGAAAAWFIAAERPGASRFSARTSSPVATPLLVSLGVGLSAAAFTGLVAVLAARRLGRLDAIDLGQAYAGATVAITGSVLLLFGLLLAALRPVGLDVSR